MLTGRAGRDDGEALVDHVRLRTVLFDGNVHLVRVRATMANALGQSVHPLPVVQRVAREADDGEDAAHFSRSTQLARAAVSLLRCLKTRTEAPASTETMGNRQNGGQYRRYAERRASHCAIGARSPPRHEKGKVRRSAGPRDDFIGRGTPIARARGCSLIEDRAGRTEVRLTCEV